MLKLVYLGIALIAVTGVACVPSQAGAERQVREIEEAIEATATLLPSAMPTAKTDIATAVPTETITEEPTVIPTPTPTSTPIATATPQLPIEHISGLDLIAAYEENAIAADARFNGRVLDITGTITDFSIGYYGEKQITLDGQSLTDFMSSTADINDMADVEPLLVQVRDFSFTLTSLKCSFSNEQAQVLIGLSKGQVVTVRGVIGDFLIIDILVNGCKVLITH